MDVVYVWCCCRGRVCWSAIGSECVWVRVKVREMKGEGKERNERFFICEHKKKKAKSGVRRVRKGGKG